jgi:prepilin-type N-terminal cleavage/methylation domain-containing protein
MNTMTRMKKTRPSMKAHKRLLTRTPQSPRGFTLTEMLVVLAIIISLLSVASLSLKSLISRSVLRETQASVLATLRLARQFAISNNSPCLVEIVAINDNQEARTTPPNTPYRAAADGSQDQLRIIPLRALRDARSGAAIYALTATPLKRYSLAEHIVFDDANGRAYPSNTLLNTDCDEDGAPDARQAEKIVIRFNADGSCPVPDGGDPARFNQLRLRDIHSGETASVVVQPASGHATAR